MKKYFIISSLFIILVACLGFTACQDDAMPTSTLTDTDTTTTRTIVMHLRGDLQRFDSSTTRATTMEWQDGARLYIQFFEVFLYDYSDTIEYLKQYASYSIATYRKATDEWIMELSGDTTPFCSVYYFENPGNVEEEGRLSLTPQTAIYADLEADCFNHNGIMTIEAHLVPQTGRVRLRGTAGQKVVLHGLNYNTDYFLHPYYFYEYYYGVDSYYYDYYYKAYYNAVMTSSAFSRGLTLTVGIDGYTPYIYATFPDSASRQLTLLQDSLLWQKSFGTEALMVGHSGTISLPTVTADNGWTKEVPKGLFYINDVFFRMMPVEGGTFTMGATSEQESDAHGNEKPPHQVTLSSYYIGETEVTQGLWQAVMGSNPSYFEGADRPVECVSWEDFQTFISKLNFLTGQTFRLPTEAEWEFAARGGNKSQGYKYSGSNSLDNVAWYQVNSGGKTHPVKTKSPNELGIYDMSGNVWEWCQDWYDSYSSSPQTNPTGPTSGYFRVCRGGSCRYDAGEDCRVSCRSYNAPDDDRNINLGFRLAL